MRLTSTAITPRAAVIVRSQITRQTPRTMLTSNGRASKLVYSGPIRQLHSQPRANECYDDISTVACPPIAEDNPNASRIEDSPIDSRTWPSQEKQRPRRALSGIRIGFIILRLSLLPRQSGKPCMQCSALGARSHLHLLIVVVSVIALNNSQLPV
jgi:hypothetical protein